MRNVAVVFGTRPEAIKLAPLIHELGTRSEVFNVEVWVTGQHREMLDQALDVFEIIPDVDFNLMAVGQDLFDVTTSVMIELRNTLKDRNPDLILVHGDTTTALAAAISAFYLGIPVGHVEAGLRTHDITSPFPEEFNRQTISRIAKWNFSPTQEASANLLKEGVKADSIYITGNTVIDSLLQTLDKINQTDQIRLTIESKLNEQLNFDWQNEHFILVTGHRRENFGNGLTQICNAIKQLSTIIPRTHFVFPVHLNPQVQKPVIDILGGIENVHLISPLQYSDFSYLLSHAYLVLTDSGGLQEEAPSLGIPVLVMRSHTEREEAVAAGTAKLVGSSTEKIISGVIELIQDVEIYSKMASAHNPFGEGNASIKIADILSSDPTNF